MTEGRIDFLRKGSDAGGLGHSKINLETLDLFDAIVLALRKAYVKYEERCEEIAKMLRERSSAEKKALVLCGFW